MKISSDLLGKTHKCVRCGEKLKITKGNTEPLPEEKPPSKREPTSETAPSQSQPSAAPERKRIGELLITDGLITLKQLKEALDVQAERGGKTFEILLSLGHLNKTLLHNFLSKQSGVAGIDLKNYLIPRELISLVPEAFARENLVIPIDKLGKLLTVGMACPLDLITITRLEELTGLRVKPMLCKLDDILLTIDRYYPKENPELEEHEGFIIPKEPQTRPAPETKPVPPREEVVARLAQPEALPTSLHTVQRVRKTVENPQASIRDIAEIVATDPSIAAKLLRVTNTAPYGMPGRVTDINVAAALLGIDGICEIAISSRVTDAHRKFWYFDYNAFAASALFSATAARAIAYAVKQDLCATAYTAALLHEIGRLALAVNFPEHYAALDEALADKNLVQAEENLFGMSHAEAGYTLVQEWGLPVQLTEPIRCHHNPQSAQEAKDLVAIVALAAFMARMHARPDDKTKVTFGDCKDLLRSLGLPRETAETLYTETETALAARKP